jgi:hypothetical protein
MLYYILERLLLLIFNYKSIYDSFNLFVIWKTILLILTMTPTIVDFLDGKIIETK